MAFDNLLKALGTVTQGVEEVRVSVGAAAQGIREDLGVIQQAGSKAAETRAEIERSAGVVRQAAKEVESAAAAASSSASKAATEIEQQGRLLEEGARQMIKTTDTLSPRLESFKARLDDGNPASLGLLQQIEAVEGGIGSMQDLLRLAGNTQIDFEGRLQNTRDLIQQLVPSVGDVQKRIADFLQGVRGDKNEIDLLLEELRDNMDAAAQLVANIGEGIRSGRNTIDELVAQLQRIRNEGLGGSEGGQIGDRLLTLLRNEAGSGRLR